MLPPETYAGVFYGPTELIYEEKLKFELGDKNVHFVLKMELFSLITLNLRQKVPFSIQNELFFAKFKFQFFKC